MTLARVSKAVPLQNGQWVGRVAESLLRGSGMSLSSPEMCLSRATHRTEYDADRWYRDE